MGFIESVIEKASKVRKKIVLPEATDRRVLEAASMVLEKGFADIVLIGNKNEIMKNSEGLDIEGIEIIDPNNSELTDRFTDELFKLREEKGMTPSEANKLLLTDYMYFACMLVYDGMADGIVSGACHSSANTMRPALQIIKTAPGVGLISSFFLMVVPNSEYGYNGTFIFSDCGLVQNPSSVELADIANSSSKSFNMLTDASPVVAMLSHSTKGSANHADVDKVREAVKLAHMNFPDLNVDGELQLDAAIVPEIAKSKAPESKVAGKANTLIFPDLDAGNIGYKLVQRLANAEAYGPITQGINKPVNDLSRGCTAEDIVGVIAITALQARY